MLGRNAGIDPGWLRERALGWWVECGEEVRIPQSGPEDASW